MFYLTLSFCYLSVFICATLFRVIIVFSKLVSFLKGARDVRGRRTSRRVGSFYRGTTERRRFGSFRWLHGVLAVLPSFIPSCLLQIFLPAFLPSFLPAFHVLLRSFLPAFIYAFLPAFLPACLPLPAFLPSFIYSFLPSFLPLLLR